jgi:PAS domain S-box-containing protein
MLAAPDGVIVIDARGVVMDFNPAAERIFGYSRAAVVGREAAQLLVPPTFRDSHRRAVRSLGSKRPGLILDRRIELTAMRSDGSEFPAELTVTQVADEPLMFAGFLRDVTERRRVTDAQDLLAAASAAFDSSLDPFETMRTIARTAVPRLAELCVIDLIREDGTIGDSVVEAVDVDVTPRLQALRAREPLDLNGTHPVARALRSREPVVVHDLTDSLALDQVAQSEEHRQFMQDVGYRSAVVIKLIARGRLMGTLSFLRTRSDRGYETEHVALMQDLADRAAMALDNANLYAERTLVAQTLQRSLLPDALPVVAGVELASVYRPVGQGSQVGGDFYDVFEVPSGCWLVVGDVCGKGTEAAAVTALARHSIRALAFRQASPAQVLAEVNQVMLSHELFGRFATAIIARLDLSHRPIRAVIAGAGHPPPIVLRANGQASSAEVSGTLLGVLANLKSHDVELELEAGDSIVLYTDGLLDAGAPNREMMPEDLCHHVEGHSGASPAELVTRLEELAVSRGAGRMRDDVAILALRVED